MSTDWKVLVAEKFDEMAVVFAVAVCIISAMVILKGDSSEIVSAGLGGLVGYLSKGQRNNSQ